MNTASFAGFLALTLANLEASGHATPEGYLAEPKSSHGPGVLVLHAWWGLNGDIKAYCDRLAKAGYIAFAPDLFEGKVVTTRAKAKALVQAHEPKAKELEVKISRAAKYLAGRTGKEQIGVIGFSFGAYYALQFSNAEPGRVQACVVYYGTGQEDFSKSKASYLGHFAEKDEFEPEAGVNHLRKMFRDAHLTASTYTYLGVGHWFAEPGVKSAYNKKAADLAWERTLQFLRTSLAAKP